MIIKLKKAHKKLIWGSEDWVVSAHEKGLSYVVGGEFDGVSLNELFKLKSELFNHKIIDEFPLLIKIIDAKDDLSIQVHPNDEYSCKNEDSLGKTECWYILECDDESDIVVGQKARTREELSLSISESRVMDQMQLLPIKKDDFFFIPAGTVHAIRANTKILEVQQSSDITYRLFDYNRVQEDGTLRELHIKKALDVINYENTDLLDTVNVIENDDYIATSLIKSEFFDVYKFDTKTNCVITNTYDYILGVCLETMEVNGQSFDKYESFIIPYNIDITLGVGSVVLSTVVSSR